MKNNIDYSLYLVTDSKLMSAENIEWAVEQALKGGGTVVQLREKEILSKNYYELGVAIKAITDKYNVPLIINDRVDIALAVDAAGVHIGPNDLSCKLVRKIIGDTKIVGVSVNNVEEALQAEKDGADYLGAGAMFATTTKNNTRPLTREMLNKIKQSVSIPVVAIGGINENNLSVFDGINIDGIAVASAIFAKKNITEAAQNIKRQFFDLKYNCSH